MSLIVDVSVLQQPLVPFRVLRGDSRAVAAASAPGWVLKLSRWPEHPGDTPGTSRRHPEHTLGTPWTHPGHIPGICFSRASPALCGPFCSQ